MLSKTLTLIRYEMKNQWLSSSTYVAGMVFLIPMILFYWEIIKDYSETNRAEFAMVAFLRLFWIPNLFVVPLLTMKSIAEERRLGTLETFMTMPISSLQFVFSKFVSAMFVYTVLWLIAATFPFLTGWMLAGSLPAGVLFGGASLLGSLVFILLSGCCFVSIGILASSLTRSQLVAGMLSFTGVFIVTVSGTLFNDSLAYPDSPFSRMGTLVEYFHTFDHFELFSQGVIDLKPFILYLTASLGMLVIASSVVEHKS